MDFNQVVSFYERIAATPKRLEIIDILSEMFQACNNPETLPHVKKIVYLTQGLLVPDFQDFPKFGIAEKMIIQAMVKFTAKKAEDIKSIINKKGDVGEAVQFLMENQTKQKQMYSLDAFAGKQKKKEEEKLLHISKLYEELEKLALIKGDKSQDNKINIINGLLRLCTPAAARYVINIILSNLRIGIADMSILDGLAQAYTESKENRKYIENAYNIHPDLGEIAQILIEKGLDGVKSISIQIGIPIRMMAASRIQYTQIQTKLGGGAFLAEYKYDGERVQVHKSGDKVLLYSRRLKSITDQYPDIVETVLNQVKAEEIIFEGEIVAMDPFFEKMLPFQIVSTRRRKYDIEKMKKEVPVTIFGFDILYYKEKDDALGINTMNLPLLKRRAILDNFIQKNDHIRLSTAKEIQTTDQMVEFFNEARAAGAEGIMNKSISSDSIYKAGSRGFLWIKLKGLEGAKMADTIDVVIIGASWGKGRKKGLMSTIFGAVYNENLQKFEYFTRIGSGFSDEDLEKFTEKFKDLTIEKCPRDVICSKEIPEIWIKPEIVIEIMGDELTISNKSDAGASSGLESDSGYSLRFPVYQRTREDKSINEITTTEEIIELYQAQG
jgi:DNA ligase-1